MKEQTTTLVRHSRKHVTVLLTGLLALLLGAAFAQDTTTASDTNPVVLRVDDSSERLDAFNDRFEIAIRGLVANMGVPLTPDIRAEFDDLKPDYLEQRITDLALLNEAARRGIEVPDEEIDAIIAGVFGNLPEDADRGALLQEAGFRDEAQLRTLVSETELIQQLVDELGSDLTSSDEEITAYYEANAAEFALPEEICARHILVDTLEEAEALQADLADGADFAELAAEHSTDAGSGARGGELECFPRGVMVAPFEEAAFSAEINEVTGPVESDFGQHLILVYDRNYGGTASLEEATDYISEQLQQQKLNAVVLAIRDAADVETFPEALAASDEDADAE